MTTKSDRSLHHLWNKDEDGKNDDNLIISIKNMISQQTHKQLIEHLHEDIAFLRTEVSQKHIIISDYLCCLKSELAAINKKLVESKSTEIRVPNGSSNVKESIKDKHVSVEGNGENNVRKGVKEKIKIDEESILLSQKDIVANCKTNIQQKLDDYIQSLTIHGLTRSLNGRKKENIFWTMILLVGLSFALFVVGGLLKKYSKYQVYTQLTSQITHFNKFPSVTFCERNLLQNSYFGYCGASLIRDSDKLGTCSKKAKKRVIDSAKVGLSWTNSPFRIKKCTSYSNKLCNNSKYFHVNPKLNKSCITWNYKGDYHDTFGHVNIQFEFLRPPESKNETEIFLVPHDPKILEIDSSKKLGIDPNYKYEIKVDKILIKRLPHPFPSNCTDYAKKNIFPGRYSRFLCIESHHYVDMFKQCGDGFDYHREYIPKAVIQQYEKNNSNIRDCLRKYTRSVLTNIKHCPLACTSYDFKYFWTFQAQSSKPQKPRYEVSIQLKAPNEYNLLEEKQLYTMRQMLCEIGGFIGLIMGMSVVSLIEVVVVVALSVKKRISKEE